MYVHVINPNKQRIESTLSKELSGDTVKVFRNAVEYVDFVKTNAALLDMLIITDGGLEDVDEEVTINDSIAALKEVFEFDLFTCDKIIAVNRKGNESIYNKYLYLKEVAKRFSKNREVEVLKFSVVDIEVIRDLISRSNLTFKPLVTNKKAVIQVDRDSKIFSSNVINELSTNNTIAVELRSNSAEKQVKEANKNNNVKISPAKDEQPIDGMDWDLELNFESMTPKKKHVKYIISTGLGGSGASTTALTMAMTGSIEGKTLLIDANPNLGLSYIVEKTLAAGKYNKINLEQILSKKDEVLNSYTDIGANNQNLSIIVGTLPALRAVGVDAIEFIILNLLSVIEDHFKFIIIDLPLNLIHKYSNIISRADVILTSCAPYVHKYVPLLNEISRSFLPTTEVYEKGLCMNFFTGIPDGNQLATSSIKEFTVFSEHILNRVLKCTRPFICNEKQYIATDIFRGIVSAAEEILNKEDEVN